MCFLQNKPINIYVRIAAGCVTYLSVLLTSLCEIGRKGILGLGVGLVDLVVLLHGVHRDHLLLLGGLVLDGIDRIWDPFNALNFFKYFI